VFSYKTAITDESKRRLGPYLCAWFLALLLLSSRVVTSAVAELNPNTTVGDYFGVNRRLLDWIQSPGVPDDLPVNFKLSEKEKDFLERSIRILNSHAAPSNNGLHHNPAETGKNSLFLQSLEPRWVETLRDFEFLSLWLLQSTKALNLKVSDCDFYVVTGRTESVYHFLRAINHENGWIPPENIFPLELSKTLINQNPRVEDYLLKKTERSFRKNRNIILLDTVVSGNSLVAIKSLLEKNRNSFNVDAVINQRTNALKTTSRTPIYLMGVSEERDAVFSQRYLFTDQVDVYKSFLSGIFHPYYLRFEHPDRNSILLNTSFSEESVITNWIGLTGRFFGHETFAAMVNDTPYFNSFRKISKEETWASVFADGAKVEFILQRLRAIQRAEKVYRLSREFALKSVVKKLSVFDDEFHKDYFSSKGKFFELRSGFLFHRHGKHIKPWLDYTEDEKLNKTGALSLVTKWLNANDNFEKYFSSLESFYWKHKASIHPDYFFAHLNFLKENVGLLPYTSSLSKAESLSRVERRISQISALKTQIEADKACRSAMSA